MNTFLQILLDIILLTPAFVLALLVAFHGWALLQGRPSRERLFSRLTLFAFITSGLAAILILLILTFANLPYLTLLSGEWFRVDHYSFHWAFAADRLSLLFCLLISSLVSLIAVFSGRYLHRDPGFFRFNILLNLFGLSSLIIVCAASLEIVFFGWELIGLTSALLISFFNQRTQPLFSGLRTYVTYRFCDIGLLAAVILTHLMGHGPIFSMSDHAWWLGLHVPSSESQILLLGLLIIWASIGKSALYPLGDWLPRAMEGPTPSSAIFYGAISVHLGVFLLLRSTPIIEASTICSVVIIIIGILSAFHATFVGRVQTDVKSILAYASMTQIGIIVIEIGLGLYSLAVLHIFGHVFLRTLQILRSPNILNDRQYLEQAMGVVLPRPGTHLERVVPKKYQLWLYRLALERGHMDTILVDRISGSILSFARCIDGFERKWARLFSISSARSNQE